MSPPALAAASEGSTTLAGSDEGQAEEWQAVPVKAKPAAEKLEERPIAQLIKEVKEAAEKADYEDVCPEESAW